MTHQHEISGLAGVFRRGLSTGIESDYGVKDYDLAYFDVADLDRRFARKLKRIGGIAALPYRDICVSV